MRRTNTPEHLIARFEDVSSSEIPERSFMSYKMEYERFIEWLGFEEVLKSESDIAIYLTLLISKGQLYKAKEFFEMERYQLKDRLKPIWYALMTLMQKEFPHEIKKMGSELQESVNSVLEEIENLKIKYQI